MAPVVEVQGITKRFPGVVANENVSLTLELGEIHALLGENGAGKSTLMNIVYGLYKQDEGVIRVNGKEVSFESPNDAIRLGIGMVHQHFMLIPVMTVAENIMLGEEETTGHPWIPLAIGAVIGGAVGLFTQGLPGLIFWLAVVGFYALLQMVFKLKLPLGRTVFGAVSGGLLGLVFDLLSILVLRTAVDVMFWPLFGIVVGMIATLTWNDKRQVAQRIRRLSQEYGLEVNPEALVSDLPVGVQQRVEILKALYRDAKVLILDEPTAVLTPQEADDLFEVMRRLTQRGVSIFFITHKLREVLAVADRISVLHRGVLVGTTTPREATRQSLARMMVGRDVVLQVEKGPAQPGDEVLAIKDLVLVDQRGHKAVNGATFGVRAGEIVGVAGVQGNGQTELVEAITGLRSATSGEITVLGRNVTNQRPRVITGLGTAHIPEDRQKHGLVLNYPIADNLVLADYYHEPFSRGIVLDEPHIIENAHRLVEMFDIRTPSVFTPASKLSGGNQQKVIVAREFS
ncbi:MAG: ABC transporter ATP-binding protein, partial [Rubrivivax sp.]|nr:ABC transporter ATP-binding protein [Rubrivivax sp.]